MHPILEMSLLRSQTLGEGTPITPPFSFPCHRPPDAGPLFYLLVPPLHHGLRSVSQATSSLTPASICCQASVPHQKDLPLLGMHLVAFSKFQKGDKNRRLPSESCISSISQFPQVLLWDWGHTENPLPWWSWTPTESMGPLFGRVLISNLAGTKWTIEDEKKKAMNSQILGSGQFILKQKWLLTLPYIQLHRRLCALWPRWPGVIVFTRPQSLKGCSIQLHGHALPWCPKQESGLTLQVCALNG